MFPHEGDVMPILTDLVGQPQFEHEAIVCFTQSRLLHHRANVVVNREQLSDLHCWPDLYDVVLADLRDSKEMVAYYKSKLSFYSARPLLTKNHHSRTAQFVAWRLLERYRRSSKLLIKSYKKAVQENEALAQQAYKQSCYYFKKRELCKFKCSILDFFLYNSNRIYFTNLLMYNEFN